MPSINPVASVFASAGMADVAAMVQTTGWQIGASADFTEYPVESGANVADHKEPRPLTIRLAGALSSLDTDAASRLLNALTRLESVDAVDQGGDTQIVTVETPDRDYPNCVVVRYDTAQDYGTVTGLGFSMTLAQLRLGEVNPIPAAVATELQRALISGQDVSSIDTIAEELYGDSDEREVLDDNLVLYQDLISAQGRILTGTDAAVVDAYQGLFTSASGVTGTFLPEDVSPQRYEFLRGQIRLLRNAGVSAITDAEFDDQLNAYINDARFGGLSEFERIRVGLDQDALAAGVGGLDADEINAVIVPLARIDAQTLGSNGELRVATDGVTTNTQRFYIELRYLQSGAQFHWHLSVGFLRVDRFVRTRTATDWAFQSKRITNGIWYQEARNIRGEGGWFVVVQLAGEGANVTRRDAFTGGTPTHVLLYTQDRLRLGRLLGD